jgi:hypothetical protein
MQLEVKKVGRTEKVRQEEEEKKFTVYRAQPAK